MTNDEWVEWHRSGIGLLTERWGEGAKERKKKKDGMLGDCFTSFAMTHFHESVKTRVSNYKLEPTPKPTK
ncbi:MAG: hypothetical protein U9N53_13350 [Bacteroidota bacterium]|nr:hypothetical protein [Bacteroidota bacterium]